MIKTSEGEYQIQECLLELLPGTTMTRLAFLVSARGSGATVASTTPPGVTDWSKNHPALSRGDKISYIRYICVSNGVNAGTPSGRGQQDAHMIGQPRKTNLVYLGPT